MRAHMCDDGTLPLARRLELTARLPVLLDCLRRELADDAGDNPACAVLAAIALEDARELAEIENV